MGSRIILVSLAFFKIAVISVSDAGAQETDQLNTMSLPDFPTTGIPQLALPPLPAVSSGYATTTATASAVAQTADTTVTVAVTVDQELLGLENKLTGYLSETGNVTSTTLSDYEANMRQKYTSEQTINLKSVVLGTLKGDPTILQSSYGVRKAIQNVIANEAIYDTNATLSANYADTETPQLNTVGSKAVVNRILSDQTSMNAGLSQLLSSGGTVNWDVTWQKSTSNVDGVITPSWYSGTGVTFAQPLMKGFGREMTEYGIRMANLDRLISNQTMRQTVIQEVGTAMIAYYDLVQSNATVLVNRIALAQAQELYRVNKAKNDAQLLPQLDVLQAQAEVALREQNIVNALQSVGNASDNLFFYFGDILNMKSVALIPQDMPALPAYELDEEKFLADARRYNPGYIQAMININKASDTRRYAYDQTRPDLTANMGVANAGIGTDGIAPFDGVLDNKYTNWNAGLAWNMPLQNRKALANYESAIIGMQQAGTNRDQVELSLYFNIRQGVRQAQTAYAQSQFGKSTVEYNMKKVDDGKNRQSVGLSTSYEVLQFEQDLANSRIQLVQALCQYNKSIIQLEMLKGTLLMNLNVTPVGDIVYVDPNKVPEKPFKKH